jgi:hypothetical protein
MSLWDIFQQVQIENLKARQATGESEAERAARRSRELDSELHDRVGRLTLVTEAMWELVSQRLDLQLADLAARVREIDARDGHEDGKRGVKIDAPQVRCASCQAVLPSGRTKCQFCGAETPGAEPDPFRL